MNPAIAFLTGPMRTGAASPITCYRRTGAYNPAQYNRFEATETAFTVIGHVGRETRRSLIANDGARQAGQLKLQTDATQAALITMKEADASQGGKLPDVVVWMGDRYIAADVDDLSLHPLPMLRTRTYSLVRENPA